MSEASALPELVREKLKALAAVERCRIILAVESGSRAWGFPSADSDYDVRFLYVRPKEWYLSIDEGRDVIERPLDDAAIDLAGWDLKKALKLLRKSNPPLLEWLQSPIIYLEDTTIPRKLREIMRKIYAPKSCMYHYFHMAQGNYKEYLRGETVRVKKYFYVMRPVLACRWIESGNGPVPMEFSRLVDAVLPDGPVKDEVERLVAEKQLSVELDSGRRRPILNEFLEAELARFSRWRETDERPSVHTEALNKLFREALLEVWGNGEDHALETRTER